MRDYIGEAFDLQSLYQKTFGYAANKFPLLEGRNNDLPFGEINQKAEDEAETTALKKDSNGKVYQMPLSVKMPNAEVYNFPLEPLISVSQKNKIIKRFPNRAVGGGSIKEYWSTDDAKISIQGLVIDFENEAYPSDQMRDLLKILNHKGVLEVVDNPLLALHNISHIVVESFDTPFTEGANAQAYKIIALSDTLFNALLDEG